MRVLAAVVLAGCSFHTNAVAPATGDGAIDVPRTIDARMIDAPGDAAVTPPDAPPDARTLPADWWNPAWHSRMKITVTDAATTAMAQGYQVGLQLDLDAAPCTGSRDAVRIVFGMTEVPRVIDEVGGAEWTWFPLQAAIAPSASSDYWLYCGNASPAAAPSDPTQVFDFFDDFSGTALGAAWASQGTVTVASGSVTIAAGNSGIHSTATYGANTAIDFMATASSGAASNPYWWGGYQTAFTLTQPWHIWYGYGGANLLQPSEYDSNRYWLGTNVGVDTAPHIYGVEHYGASGAYRIADVIAENHAFTATVGALNLRLHNYQSGGSVSFDWARVRKAVSPAPTVAVGTVETY